MVKGQAWGTPGGICQAYYAPGGVWQAYYAPREVFELAQSTARERNAKKLAGLQLKHTVISSLL